MVPISFSWAWLELISTPVKFSCIILKGSKTSLNLEVEDFSRPLLWNHRVAESYDSQDRAKLRTWMNVLWFCDRHPRRLFFFFGKAWSDIHCIHNWSTTTWINSNYTSQGTSVDTADKFRSTFVATDVNCSSSRVYLLYIYSLLLKVTENCGDAHISAKHVNSLFHSHYQQ